MTRIDVASVRLASIHFGKNLVVCFVGGSFGRCDARADSDVDIFVVLECPDHAAERAFALDFIALHREHRRSCSHIGEVFARTTLEHLLRVTEQIVGAVPDIQRVGCYHGDCVLSVFRKGDVVFKFLADPKLHIVGDREYLRRLETQASAYFRRFPMPRVQLSKDCLNISDGVGLAALATIQRRIKKSSELLDTPVGVHLEKWFDSVDVEECPSRPPATKTVTGTAALFEKSQRTCALSIWPPESREGVVVRRQCLAYTADWGD